MVLSDRQIAALVATNELIIPFKPKQVRKMGNGGKAVSSGLSSCGYDFTLGDEARILAGAGILDPKNFTIEDFPLLDAQEDESGKFFVIPPHAIMLGITKEAFNIPRDIVTICLGKSTYARLGLIVNVTPFEPSWSGTPTIEFSNTGSMPIKVYIGEGIGQLLFLKIDGVIGTSYGERPSMYQNQPNKIVGATL